VLLLLVSTIGIVVDVHYCQGHIESFGIFTEAEACSPDEDKALCYAEAPLGISKLPCCTNGQFFLQNLIENGERDIIPSNSQVQFGTFIQMESELLHYPMQLHYSAKEGPDPPLVSRDLTILYESFLI